MGTVMTSLRHLAAGAALALVLGAGAPASAATAPPAKVTFHTALTPEYYGSGEYDGTLNLNIGADGIVNGYYREEDTGKFRQVTGGISGDRIWLDLGYDGPHLNGTYKDGKIVAYTPIIGPQPYKFTATPEATQL